MLGDTAVQLTGIERVLPRDEFSDAAKALSGRIVYTTYRGETRGAGTPDREAAHAAARKAGLQTPPGVFRGRS